MSIVIYQKPTCTTCRQVHAMLKDSGVDFNAVDYYVDPIPKPRLLALLKKMQIAAASADEGNDLQDAEAR
jgi:arsenate reductase